VSCVATHFKDKGRTGGFSSTALDHFTEAVAMIEEVQFLRVEPIVIAAVRKKAPSSQLSTVIPSGCGEVWQFIRKTGLAHSGLNVAVYYDGEINLECGVIVNAPFTGDGVVNCSHTPEGEVATVAYYGPYSGLYEAYDAISARCQADNRKLAAPSWEIYGHWNDDPSKLRTDVFCSLAPSPA
jgi:effector-binding domain-containing protein